MIHRHKWPKTPYMDAKQLAKKFDVEENTIYGYAKRHGLPLKRRKAGRKKQQLKAPKLLWHKKVIILMKSDHPPTVRQVANLMRKTYAATYRVILRYKMYKKKMEYVE